MSGNEPGIDNKGMICISYDLNLLRSNCESRGGAVFLVPHVGRVACKGSAANTRQRSFHSPKRKKAYAPGTIPWLMLAYLA
jgi:hypothetical protein